MGQSVKKTSESVRKRLISEKDYLHAVNIWSGFKMKLLGEYRDHCLKRNVFLLTDVFEKFINTCLKYYGLDSCHYFSSPGLSFNATLTMTEI